ncbi:hypothetical protein [Stenotrophomonas beteli]|uniref:Uncharacterized protein n=1 Tax=Stenotrophomonas beteli TaxID=3384461 RepID=A0A0R0BD51_9GAMM|nr:hypothetical protein [Stenotrophomonas maltophilia]KRG51252.1 hypothetical protein ARC23_09685 [Stenotrophomonas maltophilia]
MASKNTLRELIKEDIDALSSRHSDLVDDFQRRRPAMVGWYEDDEPCRRGYGFISTAGNSASGIGPQQAIHESFKVLDISLCRAIEHATGEEAPLQTKQKAEKLRAQDDSSLIEPFKGRDWLMPRLLLIYEHLGPIRGSGQHGGAHDYDNGRYTIHPSERRLSKGEASTSISLDEVSPIERLALCIGMACMDPCLIDELWEKHVKHLLGRLFKLHNIRADPQMLPERGRVDLRLNSQLETPFDYQQLKDDFDYPSSYEIYKELVLDVLFISEDGNYYLVPASKVRALPSSVTEQSLMEFRCESAPDFVSLKINQEIAAEGG